jgi:hypothetical protein
MARVFASMPTRKLLIANIITLGNYSSTHNWWLQKRVSAWTRLRLTVDNRAFLAKTDMACLSTLMLLTVQHFIA